MSAIDSIAEVACYVHHRSKSRSRGKRNTRRSGTRRHEIGRCTTCVTLATMRRWNFLWAHHELTSRQPTASWPRCTIRRPIHMSKALLTVENTPCNLHSIHFLQRHYKSGMRASSILSLCHFHMQASPSVG